MNEGITDSCAGVCLCYFMQWIDYISKYIDTGKWKTVRKNIVSKGKNTTINMYFILFSRAISLV